MWRSFTAPTWTLDLETDVSDTRKMGCYVPKTRTWSTGRGPESLLSSSSSDSPETSDPRPHSGRVPNNHIYELSWDTPSTTKLEVMSLYFIKVVQNVDPSQSRPPRDVLRRVSDVVWSICLQSRSQVERDRYRSVLQDLTWVVLTSTTHLLVSGGVICLCFEWTELGRWSTVLVLYREFLNTMNVPGFRNSPFNLHRRWSKPWWGSSVVFVFL